MRQCVVEKLTGSMFQAEGGSVCEDCTPCDVFENWKGQSDWCSLNED